jgi:hypothetical protein
VQWEKRVPAGMRYVSRSGDVITWSLEMPVNDDGLFGLRCPHSADHRFAMKIQSSSDSSGSDEPDDTAKANISFCPYCGHRGEIEEFYTPEHRRRIDDAVRGVADQLAAHALDRITDVFQRSKSFTVTPSRRPPVRQLYSYTPEPTRRSMTCGTCHETYAVFGIALYCVSCGQLSPAECFTETLDVQRRIMSHLDELPADSRAQMEADGVFTKIYEDSVKNTFSALEVFLGQVFRSRVTGADHVLGRQGNIFQRLRDGSRLYEKHLGVSLEALDDQAWPVLLDAAALRHLLTHANGIVDERYLTAVPASQFQLSQRVHVDRAGAESALNAATSLAQTLLAAVDRTEHA